MNPSQSFETFAYLPWLSTGNFQKMIEARDVMSFQVVVNIIKIWEITVQINTVRISSTSEPVSNVAILKCHST